MMSAVSQRIAATSFLALSCVGSLTTAVEAQTAPAKAEQGTELKGGVTYGDAIADEVKVDKVASPKATVALIDTPQTITVISNQTLRQQNLLSLRDALSTVPGITFGAGEGGGGYGDSINLRGYSANNDITQDGVRDSAQYSRSETFNLQQIEVYNGANSVFNGSGSVGGTINLVSKTPQADDATILAAGIGTDNYYRATIDANKRLNDLIAVRLNAVYHRNDVPGRDVENNRRWGVAPAITIGIDAPTKLTLQYLHQEDNNIPVYGVPYYMNTVQNGPLPGVDRSSYFGIENLDHQHIRVNQGTLRFSHDFSSDVSLRNLTRFQSVHQNSVTSSPQGTWCLAGNVLPTATASTATTISTTPASCNTVAAARPGFFTPSGPRGLDRNQFNTLWYTQTDLRSVIHTGAIEHVLVLGGALTLEDYKIISGNVNRNADGTVPIEPNISLANPVTTWTGPLNYIRASRSTATTKNGAIYAFDTSKLGKFEFNFGLRYEQNRGYFYPGSYVTTPGATLGAYTRGATQKSKDNIFSYRAGLVFKPIDTVSIYGAYGNSQVPTSATVRLGCGTLITAPAGALDPCAAGPEKARNIEIGAKADLFERKLQLTAAIFRNERTNYRVATNDPIVTTLPVPDGHSRVDGIALGASGNLTPAWSVFANYTYLKAKVIQSVSDYCLANPYIGTTAANPCGNSVNVRDPQAGQQLINTPRHAGSLFTTYLLPFGLQLGYGFSYQGSFALNNSALVTPLVAGSTALTPVFRSKSYMTHRAFVSYPITKALTAQINVQNFTNEKYYTSIRNNGWAAPGEARSAVVSLYYNF